MLVAIWHILNSSFFLALTTILLAYAAYWLYKKQQYDQKRSAARIVLLEVKNAEKQIKEAQKALTQYRVLRDSNADLSGKTMFPERLRVMRTDNWSKYRYLFSNDIPVDLLDKTDDFYVNCRYFDESLTDIDAAFGKNVAAVRANAFRVVADYTDAALRDVKQNPSSDPKIEEENAKILDQHKKLREAFTAVFPTMYSYQPVKQYQDAEYYAELLFANRLTSIELEKALVRALKRRRLVIFTKGQPDLS